jgi:hypothetical protein
MTAVKDQITRIGNTYKKISLWLIAGLMLISFLLMSVLQNVKGMDALVVSVVYSLIISIVYGESWKSVARHSPSSLSRFYLAAMAVRLFTGALVILVAGLLLRGNKEVVLTFMLIFAVFYIVMLVFDCIYFARLEKNKLIK